MHAVADFCLVPMGVEVSVSKYIAECQRVLEKSGMKYELHGYGTGLEGEYSEVMKVIEQCHNAIHAMGCPRIATDIRIGTRVDKKGSLANKVSSVKTLLQDDSALDDSPSRPSSRRPSASASGSRSDAPTGLSMPTPLSEKPDPQVELARRMSETRQYLMSPLYDPVAGRDA
ncbi:hypothetical protein JCM10908_001282 [Rhodotorula pacifica]|uniref:Ecm15p n=1 Tax=Rhodotorula pacifica TaxID=1495444 RepID=UPI0031809EC7